MRYIVIVALLIAACQRSNTKVYIVTCRKQQSYIDVMGVTNKFVMMYIDDSTRINLQHLEAPYIYDIYLSCDDTLARVSNRLYKALQKEPSLYECSYRNVVENCLKNPRDTIYKWSGRVYAELITSDSIKDEVSIIDLIISQEVYEHVFNGNAFVLVAANTMAYCDCPVYGYLILKPESEQRVKEITVKHYPTKVNGTKW
jgi:hypothetical protein